MRHHLLLTLVFSVGAVFAQVVQSGPGNCTDVGNIEECSQLNIAPSSDDTSPHNDTDAGEDVITEYILPLPPGLSYATVRPANSILVRLGFDKHMHYAHLLAHPIAIRQIFEFLPMGIAYGLGLENANATPIHLIQPFHSRRELGYIRTLVFVYIPRSKLEELDNKRYQFRSGLYNNSNRLVRKMMSYLDPTVPLRGQMSGSDLEENSGEPMTAPDGDWLNGPDATAVAEDKDIEATDGPESDNEKGDYGKTNVVGAAVGAALGAMFFGALATFFILRKRYTRRKSEQGQEAPREADSLEGFAPDVKEAGLFGLFGGRWSRKGRRGAELEDTGRAELENTERAELEGCSVAELPGNESSDKEKNLEPIVEESSTPTKPEHVELVQTPPSSDSTDRNPEKLS
ncbi:hypothetical protein BJ508DRAFT_324050 [Ascobolus immersus RN42]|uniref:Uncharacterized protein n=1 Tax=Ascobolus immersus RN42 TaxID=1160509 RepID=A0A3N4ID63_ASCIM|nr:hypothetical protein BJ508DRAFT_324050 [Ascobolus immersus RN42]